MRFLRRVFIAIMLLTALGLAAYYAAGYAVREYGQQVLKSEEGQLAVAVINNHPSKVQQLISKGASPNSRYFGMTSLYWAAGKCNLPIIKQLLDAGADIDAHSGPAKRTALHEAALRGCIAGVRVLLERGANANSRNENGRTPLQYVTDPPVPLQLPDNASTIATLLRQFGGRL